MRVWIFKFLDTSQELPIMKVSSGSLPEVAASFPHNDTWLLLEKPTHWLFASAVSNTSW